VECNEKVELINNFFVVNCNATTATELKLSHQASHNIFPSDAVVGNLIFRRNHFTIKGNISSCTFNINYENGATFEENDFDVVNDLPLLFVCTPVANVVSRFRYINNRANTIFEVQETNSFGSADKYTEIIGMSLERCIMRPGVIGRLENISIDKKIGNYIFALYGGTFTFIRCSINISNVQFRSNSGTNVCTLDEITSAIDRVPNVYVSSGSLTFTINNQAKDCTGINKGTTTQRTNTAYISDGHYFFDTTLKKAIIYNGSAWVNMDGSAL